MYITNALVGITVLTSLVEMTSHKFSDTCTLLSPILKIMAFIDLVTMGSASFAEG